MVVAKPRVLIFAVATAIGLLGYAIYSAATAHCTGCRCATKVSSGQKSVKRNGKKSSSSKAAEADSKPASVTVSGEEGQPPAESPEGISTAREKTASSASTTADTRESMAQGTASPTAAYHTGAWLAASAPKTPFFPIASEAPIPTRGECREMEQLDSNRLNNSIGHSPRYVFVDGRKLRILETRAECRELEQLDSIDYSSCYVDGGQLIVRRKMEEDMQDEELTE